MNGKRPEPDYGNPHWRWPWEKFGLEPEALMTTLHDRFNTRSCPIQEFRGFLLDVRECGRDASDQAEFYASLGRRRDQRTAELQETWYNVREFMKTYHYEGLDRCQEPCCLNRLATGDNVRASPKPRIANDTCSEHFEWFRIMSGSMAFDAMVRYFDGFVRELREVREEEQRRKEERARKRAAEMRKSLQEFLKQARLEAQLSREDQRQKDAAAEKPPTQSPAPDPSADTAQIASDRSSPTLAAEASPPPRWQKADGGPDRARPLSSEGANSKATAGASPSTPCKKRLRTDDELEWATSEDPEQGGCADAQREPACQQAGPRNKRRRISCQSSSSSSHTNVTTAGPGDDVAADAHAPGVATAGPRKGEEAQPIAAAGDSPRSTLGPDQDPPPHGTSWPASASGAIEEPRGPPSPPRMTEEEEEELLHATQYPRLWGDQLDFDFYY